MARAKLVPTGLSRKRGQPVCGRCGRKIQPGENRYEWFFRYGGRQVRCTEHPPQPSELTNSEHLSALYAAQEQITDAISEGGEPTTREELVDALAALKAAVESAADAAHDAADAYREAAEPFGGAGENGERADAAESFADELDNVDINEDVDEEPDAPGDEPERGDFEDADSFKEAHEEWEAAVEAHQEWVDSFEAEGLWQEAVDAAEAARDSLEL